MPRPPPSIRILDPIVANQIAAGEVVTRPASVVKELIENSIDARARRLQVEIEGGGTKRIAVIDDGHGMERGDVVLAVRRHATSKIRVAADLQGIQTLGFRGEALPSIASVSRLVLRTRAAAEDSGTELRIDGGSAAEPAPVGCAPGTSVQVVDLFFNVPARRKFLRAVATESAHVTEAVLEAALAHPALSVTLVRDGRQVREWLGTANREERVAQVLRAPVWALCAGARGPVMVEAYLAAPERARTGAGGLRLFVNDRPVTDRALARAVATAFGPALDHGRYPLGAVFLTVPPDLVDVNVHPQKAEVRFAHARAITDALFSVVRAELEGRLGPAGGASSAVEPGNRFSPSRLSVNDRAKGSAEDTSWTWPDSVGSLAAAPPPADAWPSGSSTDRPAPANSPRAAPLSTDPGPAPTPSTPRYVARAHGRFLLYEAMDGLLVVDQPAAQRLLALHRMLRESRAGGVPAQRLLFPVMRQVPPATGKALETTSQRLNDLGLDARPAGPEAIALHAVPEPLCKAPAEALLDDLVRELHTWQGVLSDERVGRLLILLSRHAAVPDGDAPNAERALALLSELLRLPADAKAHADVPWPLRRLSWPELACDGAGR